MKWYAKLDRRLPRSMCILGVCLIFDSRAIVTRVNCPFNLVSLCINQKN